MARSNTESGRGQREREGRDGGARTGRGRGGEYEAEAEDEHEERASSRRQGGAGSSGRAGLLAGRLEMPERTYYRGDDAPDR